SEVDHRSGSWERREQPGGLGRRCVVALDEHLVERVEVVRAMPHKDCRALWRQAVSAESLPAHELASAEAAPLAQNPSALQHRAETVPVAVRPVHCRLYSTAVGK